GERVAVLRDGVLQQVDNPQNLYNHPANLFVAAFIGSPPMNLVEAKVTGGEVSFAGYTLPLSQGALSNEWDGRTVVLGIRPPDMEDAAVWNDPTRPYMDVKADVTEELGSEVNVLFTIDAPPVKTEQTLAAATETDPDEALPLLEEDKCIFCARVDARTGAKPGGNVRL